MKLLFARAINYLVGVLFLAILSQSKKCSFEPKYEVNDINYEFEREAPMERWEEVWTDMENVNSSDCPALYQRYSTEHSYCKKSTCNIIMNGVTEGDKKDILNLHNSLRNKLALGNENKCKQLPPAANMMEMEWDDELARIAQAHANICILEFDSYEERKTENFDRVGQAIVLRTNCRKSKEWYPTCNSWYEDHVCSYSPDNNHPFRFTRDSAYFTEFTWANTWKLGCGFANFRNTKGNRRSLYVCNYGPEGNIPRGTHYIVGDPCSRCPKNTTCSKEYPGLCKSSTENGPQRTRLPSDDFLLVCDFSEDDTEACNDVIVTGPRNFTTRYIYTGAYKTVVLQGGESLTIDLGKIKNRGRGVCFFVHTRYGPSNAKDAFGSKFKFEFIYIRGQTSSHEFPKDSGYRFLRMGLGTGFGIDVDVEVETKFKIEVEEGAAPQYIDFQSWGIFKGSCKDSIYSDSF